MGTANYIPNRLQMLTIPNYLRKEAVAPFHYVVPAELHRAYSR